MIKVRVPATTANLGIGFDVLGCALSLYATFTFEKSNQLVIEGCPIEYANEDNLIVQAYYETLRHMKIEKYPLHIVIDSNIPIERGLGSSAACIVAGVVAANKMHENRLSQSDLIKIASDLEGHPDNVTPALLGGLCASIVTKDQVCCIKYPVHLNYRFYLLVPDFKVSTHQARMVLPDVIEHAEAVSNLAQLPFFLKALETGDSELLQMTTCDHLHEPYRSKLIEDYDSIKQISRQFDGTCLISGSGPTLILITKEEILDELSKLLKQCIRQWEILPLTIDTEGTKEEIC